MGHGESLSLEVANLVLLTVVLLTTQFCVCYYKGSQQVLSEYDMQNTFHNLMSKNFIPYSFPFPIMGLDFYAFIYSTNFYSISSLYQDLF